MSTQTQTLPSAHQLEDKVTVSFGKSGVLLNCEVIKVHFSPSKVMYDVEVEFEVEGDDEPRFTRLYNVDSACITK